MVRMRERRGTRVRGERNADPARKEIVGCCKNRNDFCWKGSGSSKLLKPILLEVARQSIKYTETKCLSLESQLCEVLFIHVLYVNCKESAGNGRGDRRPTLQIKYNSRRGQKVITTNLLEGRLIILQLTLLMAIE